MSDQRSGFDLLLNAAGMKNIGINDIQGDFTFVIGEKTYSCTRIIARFLSPAVSLLHSIDPTIGEYIAEIEDYSDQFNLFMLLGDGSSIWIDETNSRFFLLLSLELGNNDLYYSVLDHFHRDLSPSQLCESTFLRFPSNTLIEVISLQFYKLKSSELDKIPLSTLFHILSHESLTVSSEDSLYSYICSRLSDDPGYGDLLRFVRFEYLSSALVSDFLSKPSIYLGRELWGALSQGLISRLHLLEVPCPLQGDKSLDGIISYLTRKHGGNVHEKRIVTIYSKSVYSDLYAVKNVADLAHSSLFWSKHEPDQWICWDFHTKRVRPTHYTIRSCSLRSWIVESSLDAVNWIEIDRQTDNSVLPSDGIASFAMSTSRECCFIRLSQATKVQIMGDPLVLQAVEFFGVLLD
jgi:hypothetical protein